MRSAGRPGEDEEEGARVESPFKTDDTIDPSLLRLLPDTLRDFPASRRIESFSSTGWRLFRVYVSLLRARKRARNPGRNGRRGGKLGIAPREEGERGTLAKKKGKKQANKGRASGLRKFLSRTNRDRVERDENRVGSTSRR